MKFKKLLSASICLSLLLGSVAFVKADVIPESSWNYSVISEENTVLYEAFPMTIDKTVNDLELSLQFKYLKNISETDSVSVIVKDLADNSVVKSWQLSSENTYIIWDEVENNKNFSVSINENLNGMENNYTGYISTGLEPADFPVDVTFGNTEYNLNNGEEFESIMIKAVGAEPVCNHPEDEECGYECTYASLINHIPAEELDTFWSELDSNKLYEVQMQATADGFKNHYKGFISTMRNGEELGIFTRGYTFSKTNPVSQLSSSAVILNPAEASVLSQVEVDPVPAIADEDPPEYLLYTNCYFRNVPASGYYVIKWTVPETGNYIVETIGNAHTMIGVYQGDSVTGEPSSTPQRIIRNNSGGNNASANLNIMYGQVRYFVVQPRYESNTTVDFGFRIVRSDYPDVDGIPNSLDIVQANAASGNYSAAINNDCRIEYNGDINYFVYSATRATGQLRFANVDTPLKVNISIKSPGVNNNAAYPSIWTQRTLDIEESDYGAANDLQIEHYTFTKEDYYIDISQQNLPTPDSNPDEYYEVDLNTYDFGCYLPGVKDSVDTAINNANNFSYGDVPAYCTELTSFPHIDTSRTINTGDNDWYKITTGAEGGNLEAILYQAHCSLDLETTIEEYLYQQYNIDLYEAAEVEITDTPDDWYVNNTCGTVTTVDSISNNGDPEYFTRGYKKLTHTLAPNSTYYVHIYGSGGYSSLFTYEININITTPEIPSAVLSGNVPLSHTAGTNISDLSAFYNTVMSSLTCYINGVEVSDSEASSEVELYYNNQPLTVDIVNGLSANTYNLTVKYKDAQATGGTVTLTVNPAAVQEDIVEIEIPTTRQNNSIYDGIQCAKILADYTLAKNGLPVSTLTVDAVASQLQATLVRTDKIKVTQAANIFYNGLPNGNVFAHTDVDYYSDEDTLYEIIDAGYIVLMQLADSENPDDASSMRYIIVHGVNKTTHELLVYHPLFPLASKRDAYVSTSTIMNGGFISSNPNIKYSGVVIIDNEM